MTDEKKPRGFAAISPERRREISSKGGKSAHAKGTAHQFTTEEAKIAGAKGGVAPHASRGRASKGETSNG
jgi:general stress protein YciG